MLPLRPLRNDSSLLSYECPQREWLQQQRGLQGLLWHHRAATAATAAVPTLPSSSTPGSVLGTLKTQKLVRRREMLVSFGGFSRTKQHFQRRKEIQQLWEVSTPVPSIREIHYSLWKAGSLWPWQGISISQYSSVTLPQSHTKNCGEHCTNTVPKVTPYPKISQFKKQQPNQTKTEVQNLLMINIVKVSYQPSLFLYF